MAAAPPPPFELAAELVGHEGAVSLQVGGWGVLINRALGCLLLWMAVSRVQAVKAAGRLIV